MDNRLHPLRTSQRLLTYLVCGLVAWQPLLPAMSAAITPVTGGTQMDRAANGVPVLNIATPNGAGISHNQFKDYNVGKEGLILNNATGQLNQTQLGGIIQNNPNLRAGQEARGIINEVTGGSRSQLQGYTEVAGKAANVIVANPYGITCSGCGFINTPNATLTTGKPQFDDKGNLSALNVTGGTITVEGKGLDASNSSALSLISRATEVNAAIHAKDLKVIAGANRVGADGSVSAIEGDGPAPTVAVDTGALGGMYASRIHLVSSEKGVGVNLGNLNARQGDIQLDASGKLVLNNSLSSGALTVKAKSAELSGDNKAAGAATVTAQNGIALKQGALVSDKTVSLNAGDRVDIASGKVTAGETIRLAGSGLAIDNASTADAAGSIDLNAQGGVLDNAGQMTAGQAMTLNASTVSNTGTLAAKGRLDATGRTLDNQGTLSAGGDVGLNFDDRIRNGGSILADGTLEATTGELVQDGKLSGRNGVTAKSDTLSSGKGAQTLSEGDITVNARHTADIAGEVNAGGSLTLNSGTLNTDTTARLQGQNVDLTATKATLNGTQAAKQALSVKADTLAHGGKSSAEKVILNAADTLNNSGTLSATDLVLESGDITNSGLLQGTGSLSLLADRLDNQASGSLHTLGDFALNLPDFTNSGLLSVGGQLQLDGDRLTNSGEINAASLTSNNTIVNNLAGGRLLATDTMQLTHARLDNGGQITAGQLSLNTGTLNNLNGGELLSDGQMTLTAGDLANGGLLQGEGLNLTADSWRNDGVALSAQDATVRVKNALTNSGKILGQQGVDLTAASTDNAGQVVAKVLALHGDLVNSGLLQGDDSLTLQGQTLKNDTGGQMLSAGNTTLDAGTLDNRGELQASALGVTANDWTNSGTVRATNGLTATLNGALDNSGELLGGKGLTLNVDGLQNTGLVEGGELLDIHARTLANDGGIQADRLTLDIGESLQNGADAELLATEEATLKAQRLDNAGTVVAKTLSASGDTLTNSGTLQGDSTLSATFGDIANQADGKIVSGGKMTVTGGDISNDGQWQAQQLELNADGLANRGDINGIAGVAGTLIGKLDNSGTLRSQGTTRLQADSLLNSGRLMADSLTLEANTLDNQGLLQGNGALNARADTIAQSADGRMLTSGTLALTGGQLTTDGKLQGQQVTLDADDWQHNGSLVGGSSLLATVANQLVNDGELMNLGDMQLNAGTLDNRGSVLSSGDITLAGNRLKNSGSVQGLTLGLSQGQVSNGGKLIGIDALTVAAPVATGRMMRTLMAQPERELRNEQGGSMLTQGDLILHSDNVINNGSWQGKNILLNAQRLNNGGDIQSAGDTQLVLGDSLTSAAGSKIVANGAAALQALTLTNQGEWLAKNLTLKADTLANGGTVSGVNSLTLDLRDGLTQQQGSTLQTGGDLVLNIDELDNLGRIQAGTLAIAGNKLTNSGSLQGDNGLTLTMRDSLTNTASGTLLSQKGVTLTAPELINYGLIQGGNASTLTATNSVRNDGKILNDGALTVTGPALANTGMLQATDLILNAANVGNSGTLLGSDSLNVTAQQLNQQATGKLLSGGNLMLSSNGFDQLGQVVALGDATLKLVNSFNGRGTLAAGKKLNVSSHGELVNNGLMQGDSLDLSADGALTNNGTLTSGNGASTLSGSRITIGSTGSLQGGGDIDLNSRSDITLNGFTGSGGTLTLSAPGSIVNTALLYGANNLWLLADSIKNQGGNILAGDNLWMQRDKAGAANSEILNTSGTIETTNGDITLRTGHLLNQWESITQGESKTENLATSYPSTSPGTVELPLSLFTPDDIHYRALIQRSPYPYLPDKYYAEAFPKDVNAIKEMAVSRVISTTKVTGSAGRISAGGNLSGVMTSLDNLGSYILAGKSLSLVGERLNNQSWLSGAQTVWRKYTVAPYYEGNSSPGSGLEVASYGRPFSDTSAIPLYKNSITFIVTDEYRTEGGSSLRGVIQSNGDVTTRFGTIENNSESTDVRGTIAPTLTRPGLQTLVQHTLSGETDGAEPTEFKPSAVNSPEWRDQLQNALQQVNGGSTLDLPDGRTVSLADYPQGSIKYAADGTVTVLDANPWQQHQQVSGLQAKPLDTSAYPLPQGDNGYFTVADTPDSPYLITINPKLNGLGALDKNVYGDLYQLLNMQPGAAPVETRPQYADKSGFLGSSYFLDRLNLKPEYDYRILGDAVFDTRYVSNAVLSQTGNRYINGMGSDLEQMKYLMDNAAAAQQSLGLQAGVTLTADQIASLDHSILWWEAATINGQTVLVPKLYLAAGDVTINNGSVIAGNNVTIDGDSVSNNGSTLLAKQGMTIDSQTGIDNRNASLIKAGEGLQLSAVEDINNIGSTISGKQVALESFEGDINNLTLTTQTRNDSRWSRSQFTEQGEKATIGALDSLSLSAGKNISVAGAALSAGGDTALKAGGSIDILANENSTLFDSDWRHYKSGSSVASTLESGGKLDINAGDDLTIQASNIDGAKGVLLTAGNDLNLQSAKNSVQDNKWGRTYNEILDRTTLTSGDGLSLTAGRDLNSQAAGMAAEGDVALQAGRDIALQSEATRNESYSGSGGNREIKKTVRQQGTEIAAGGDIAIQAGRDLISNAAQVVAQEDIAVSAGENVNFNTATESDYYYKEVTKTKKGFLSKKTTTTIQEDSATREKGTLLSGTNVSVEAGKNILVNGSQVVGDEEVALKAGDNINILAATNTNSSWRFSETKKSGLMGSGGIGFTIGSSKTTHDLKQKGTTQSQSVSTVGSTGGNVTIASGGQVHLNGSDVVAGKGITVESDNVLVTAGHDKNITDEVFKQKTAGLTLALSGTVGDAINSAVLAAQAASTQSDSRLAALQGAKAALSGYQAAQAVRLDAANGSDPSNGATVGIMLSLGAQSSKSQSHSEQDTTRSATLNAGNNLILTANGKGQQANSGDINVEGGQLKAGQDVTLDAARDITLQAAKDTQMMTGSNSSKGGSIGVGLTAGSGGTGITVSASVNASKGNQKGNGTSWNETNIDAGNQVTLNSGRDTTLSGALVNGDKVVADVGRDLTVASLQDSNNYDSKQQSVSAGASFTWGVPGGSASFSYSRDKMKSIYDSVQEQSGIYAGKGGFDLTVGSHTQLDGAVLASTAEAEKNRLDTGTLGFSDIHNEADYKVEHQGVGISTSGSMAMQGAMNLANNLLASAGGSGHAEGTTQAAVADGTINVRDQANQKQDVTDLSRDTANANGAIGQIFDKEKEQKRLQAAQMIGELGSQMEQVARTEGQIAAITAGKAELAKNNTPEPDTKDTKGWEEYNKKLIATPAYKDAMDQWGTGSTIQRAIQATTAAAQGLAGGDIAAALAGGAAPFIANVIGQTIPEDNLLGRALAHATVNAALAAAQGKDMGVAAAGAATGEIAAAIATASYGKTVSQLTESEKQTVSALATLASALAGGLIGDSGADAMAAAQVGKTTAENNHLSTGEKLVLQDKEKKYRASCQGENASNSSCQGLKEDIDKLKEKGSSIDKVEENELGPDFQLAGTEQIKNNPGDIVSCVNSSNGYCVVTEQSAKNGREWVLTEANEVQAIAAKHQNGKAEDFIKELGAAYFNAGCGLSGGVSAICQAYSAAGGANPIDGKVPTDGERLLWAMSAAGNTVGGATLVNVELQAIKSEAAFGKLPLVRPRSSDNIAPAPGQFTLSGSTVKQLAKDEVYIYVIDSNNNIKVALRGDAGRTGIKHTQLTGGEAARGAGELKMTANGTIELNNQSGRYRAQSVEAVESLQKYLSDMNIKTTINDKAF